MDADDLDYLDDLGSLDAAPDQPAVPAQPGGPARSQDALDIEQVFDRAAIGMALVALDGTPLRVNKAYADLLGTTEQAILSGSIADFVPAHDREMELARHLGVAAGAAVSGVKKRYTRPDGTVVYGLLASWLITDADGMPAHVFVQVLDITDRHHATERIALMSERLEEAQRIAEVGSFAYDHATGQVETSAQFRRIYRLPDVPSFSFDNLVALLPEPVRDAMSALISGHGTDPEQPRKAHHGYADADGVARTVISQARTETDDAGAPVLTTGTSQDATALLALQKQVELAASHDRLTGLANRQTVADAARALLLSAEATGAPVAALLVDLDGFRTVNDSLGHAAGDDLLCQVADRLRGQIAPAGAYLSRSVGDEFVVVCDNADADAANALAGRIAAALAAPIQAGDRRVFVRACIGIAVAVAGQAPGADPGTDQAEALLAAAAEALSEAKAKGRGQSKVFTTSRRPAIVARMTLEQDLWAALDDGQITSVYQPVVDLRTGRVVQAEALARWNHPVRGNVSPDEFIGVAEEAGLAPRVGEAVLRQAAATLVAFAAAGRPDIAVSVNLSGQQIVHGNLPELVAAVLAEHGLPGNRLIVEITESAAVVAGGSGREQLAALRAAGVRVALDDFGTGYSSLSSVRDLPLDYVKVDRSFSSTVLTDPVNAEIVTAVARLTHALHGTVISEGVETAEQLDRLLGLGIDLAQGWHLGRPVTADALTALLSPPG